MSLALFRSGTFALFFAIFVQKVWSQAECDTFGLDFHDGNSYFQNSLSTENFTFASVYTNCQDAIAKNVLVPPSGPFIYCSDTPLRPDNTSELSTW